jgi:Secretion system C-terminal sorting domain
MPFTMKGIFFGTLFEIYFVYLQIKLVRMAKNYFYTLILLVFLFSASTYAQDNKQQPKLQETASTIEGLSLYPNPVSNGKVYITTKNDLDKEIIIFDVLGKKVLQTVLSSKELNVSNLSSGVYIIKINEKESSATRKLIIR